MSFIDEFKTAFKKQDGIERQNAKKWLLSHPTLTAGIFFFMVAVVGWAVLNTAIPPVPEPPTPTVDLAGFISLVFSVQFPPLVWLLFFLFLWMTKW